MCEVLQIYSRVMALDCHQHLIFTQYFENDLMELDQMLHNYALMLPSKLGLLHVNFCAYTTQLWPLVIVNFISTQYLGNRLLKFDQVLHMH